MRFWIAIPLFVAAAYCWQNGSREDEIKLKNFMAEYDRQWNNHRFEAKDRAPDFDVINVYGGREKGAKQLELINGLLAGPFREIQIDTAIEQIRFVRPDVAVIIGHRTHREHPRRPPGDKGVRAVLVLSKEQGEWKLNTTVNVQIRQPPAQDQ